MLSVYGTALFTLVTISSVYGTALFTLVTMPSVYGTVLFTPVTILSDLTTYALIKKPLLITQES